LLRLGRTRIRFQGIAVIITLARKPGFSKTSDVSRELARSR
jgi:hypothetical protein